jgi:hypothetical protein
LKSQISIRTWADWDEQAPGFVEIDLVGHEGGDPRGEFARTLTVTDVFTGWTETRRCATRPRSGSSPPRSTYGAGSRSPSAGLTPITAASSSTATRCVTASKEQITFTRSRAGNKNDGCHVEQKNWSVVRRAVGYHRYDTSAELELLNTIYGLLRLQTNFFSPQTTKTCRRAS